MAYIQRAISDILNNRVQNSKCTMITGARQVGKSTLVKHDFSQYNRTNFDDRLTRLQAKEEPSAPAPAPLYKHPLAQNAY